MYWWFQGNRQQITLTLHSRIQSHRLSVTESRVQSRSRDDHHYLQRFLLFVVWCVMWSHTNCTDGCHWLYLDWFTVVPNLGTLSSGSLLSLSHQLTNDEWFSQAQLVGLERHLCILFCIVQHYPKCCSPSVSLSICPIWVSNSKIVTKIVDVYSWMCILLVEFITTESLRCFMLWYRVLWICRTSAM